MTEAPIRTERIIDIAEYIKESLEVPSEETATAMAQACSFRNVLAHRYGHVIDDETVYEALQDLSRFRDFLLEVRDFLDRVDAL